MANIPSGFSLVVSSYENDGDNRADCSIHGLNKDDVRFYIEFLNMFSSWGGQHNFGNKENDNGDVIVRVVREVIAKHPNSISAQTLLVQIDEAAAEIESGENKYAEDSVSVILEEVRQFVGNCGEGYCDFTNFVRCVDGITVYHYPTEVKDVTAKF